MALYIIWTVSLKYWRYTHFSLNHDYPVGGWFTNPVPTKHAQVILGSCSPIFAVKIFQNIWVFPKIGVPQNGWFIMENPIKTGWFGGVYTTIFGNIHLNSPPPSKLEEGYISHEETHIFPRKKPGQGHFDVIGDDIFTWSLMIEVRLGGGLESWNGWWFWGCQFFTTDAWDGVVNHGKKLPSSSGEFTGLLLAIQQYGFCQRASCLWGWYL